MRPLMPRRAADHRSRVPSSEAPDIVPSDPQTDQMGINPATVMLALQLHMGLMASLLPRGREGIDGRCIDRDDIGALGIVAA